MSTGKLAVSILVYTTLLVIGIGIGAYIQYQQDEEVLAEMMPSILDTKLSTAEWYCSTYQMPENFCIKYERYINGHKLAY